MSCVPVAASSNAKVGLCQTKGGLGAQGSARGNLQGKAWGFLAGLAGLAVLGLLGCAAAPIHVECQEERLHMSLSDQSEDQRRWSEEQLVECEKRLESAKTKDSATVENLNQRFTPKDSL